VAGAGQAFIVHAACLLINRSIWNNLSVCFPGGISMSRSRCIAGIALLATIATANAIAQAWPSKPVRIILGSAAGSGPDTLTRNLAERFAKAVGQPVVVDNRPGANGVIAAQAGARAPADGYTLLLATSSSFSVNPHTIKALPYDPIKDFSPVILVATGGLALIANPKVPFKTLQELIAYDKAQPGKLSVATEGPVAGSLLAYLNRSIGTKLVQIPYNSPPQTMQDTLAGRTELTIASIIVATPFVRRGELRPIAVMAPRRDPTLPDVPSAAETVPGFGIYAWVMFVAPAGTPPDIVRRMNTELDRILKDPEVVRWMLTFGNRAEGGTAEHATEFVRADTALWGRIAQDAGLKPE
jgi:tripartite-type tricarboxylate transporter receptor subunit TctC